MFCKNCGQQYVADEAVICVKCGAQRGTGNSYCPNCGQPTQAGNSICMHCGIALNEPAYGPRGNKSKVAAGLLGIFLGSFGVHNFYLGYTGKAVAQLVITLATCGFGATVSGIWGVVEGILILTGSINTDSEGRLLND
ncbi:MAG: NINE protein [Roseburia sp.]